MQDFTSEEALTMISINQIKDKTRGAAKGSKSLPLEIEPLLNQVYKHTFPSSRRLNSMIFAEDA